MNSQDSSMRPSEALRLFGGKGGDKLKRRKVSKEKSEQGSDTSKYNGIPVHPSVLGLSRENRILEYQRRVSDDKKKRVLGKNNLPLNVFTGIEYTAEELEVVDIGEPEQLDDE